MFYKINEELFKIIIEDMIIMDDSLKIDTINEKHCNESVTPKLKIVVSNGGKDVKIS